MLIRPCLTGVVLMLGVCPQAACQGGQALHAEQPARVGSTDDHAGFSIPRLGDSTELRYIENANGVMYGIDVYRSDPADPHRYADVTPLVRLSQSIPSLEKIGSLDDLLKAVVADAQLVMKGNGLNEALGETSDCTREIMGEERTGLRFDAVLSNDTLLATEPVTGHVECYAFEHEGKGVSVMLKVAESDERSRADDTADVAALMTGTRMIPVDSMTPYTYLLGGYPVGLPVGSRIKNLEQTHENTITGEVTLEGVSLHLYLMQVPEGDSVDEAFAQVDRMYEDQVRRSISRSQGRLRLKWKSSSALPAGKDRLGFIDAPVFMLATPDRDIYSVFYKNIDGRALLTGVFNAESSRASKAHDYARIFVDAFGGSVYDAPAQPRTLAFPGRRVTLAGEVSASPLRDESGEIGSTVFMINGPARAEQALRSVRTHRAFTVVRSAASGQELDLGATHASVIERIRQLGVGTGDEAGAPAGELPEPEEVGSSREDGAGLGWISTDFAMPWGGEQDRRARAPETVRVQSCAVEGMVVSVVSPPAMGDDARAMGAQLIGEIEPDPRPGVLELGNETLSYDPARLLITSERDERRKELHTTFSLDGDIVDVYTSDPDSGFGVISDTLLTAQQMRPKWSQIVYDDEEELFPAQIDALERIGVAGHNGFLFRTTLVGSDDEPGRNRKTSMGVAIVGFLDQDRYTTIIIKQAGVLDEARMTAVLDMFRSGR